MEDTLTRRQNIIRGLAAAEHDWDNAQESLKQARRNLADAEENCRIWHAALEAIEQEISEEAS